MDENGQAMEIQSNYESHSLQKKQCVCARASVCVNFNNVLICYLVKVTNKKYVVFLVIVT